MNDLVTEWTNELMNESMISNISIKVGDEKSLNDHLVTLQKTYVKDHQESRDASKMNLKTKRKKKLPQCLKMRLEDK